MTADRRRVAKLEVEHADYVRAVIGMFAAVDRHEPADVVNAIDGRSVDPVFGAMLEQVDAASASHERVALREGDGMRTTLRRVLWIDGAALLAGVLLIVAAGIALNRSRRRLQAQSELNRQQALYDDLTGLPNRTLFQDRLAQALSAAARTGDAVAVLLVDLDRFKAVNDTLGHHHGDLLLQQIAARITQMVRGGDLVARLGGDEFAVLLVATSGHDAVTAAQALTEALRGAFQLGDVLLDVEASIGIALAGPGTDGATTLRHADVAMYEAKHQHLPYALYQAERDDNTVARLELLGDLRRAIAAGELTLDYQPKVDAATGAVHGVEALARWNHPTRGLVMPEDFLHAIESTALNRPFVDEVLRMALAQARKWMDRGWAIPVSVNISPRSLHDLSFPGQVRHQLEANGVPATLLILELTEGAIMTDPGRALVALETLSAMGIRLSIDDFGTGYSSMAYLKDLPVRELKIDRSFVMEMHRNPGDRVIVRSAIELGHNLGLSVVAEGVEDAEAQAALAAMGCDVVQGYHVHRPSSAADLDPWLADQRLHRSSPVSVTVASA